MSQALIFIICFNKRNELNTANSTTATTTTTSKCENKNEFNWLEGFSLFLGFDMFSRKYYYMHPLQNAFTVCRNIFYLIHSMQFTAVLCHSNHSQQQQHFPKEKQNPSKSILDSGFWISNEKYIRRSGKKYSVFGKNEKICCSLVSGIGSKMQ